MLINNEGGCNPDSHCHLRSQGLFYMFPFISFWYDAAFSCIYLGPLDIACPNNSTISNVTIPVVSISKEGADIIDKYINSGKKGKPWPHMYCLDVFIKVSFLLDSNFGCQDVA